MCVVLLHQTAVLDKHVLVDLRAVQCALAVGLGSVGGGAHCQHRQKRSLSCAGGPEDGHPERVENK